MQFVLLLGLSGQAWAQAPAGSGFDAHGFKLAGHDADARDPLVVVRPGGFDGQSWFAGGLLEYASQPLVFQRAATSVELDDLYAANISAGYAPHERVRLDVAVPLFFYAEGVGGALGGGIGDARVTGLVNLVRPDPRGGLGLGMVFNLDAPTGRPENFLGQVGLGGGVGLAATYEGDRITLTATGSSQLRPNTDPAARPQPTQGGDAIGWGAAVGYLVSDNVGLNVEAHGEVPVDEDVLTAIGIPAELLISMRQVREDGGFLTAGLGTALSRGAGSSPLRLVVGGGFGQVYQVRDADGDGISDASDACPAEAETGNGFRDEDGCPDVLPKIVFRAVDGAGTVRDDAILSVGEPWNMEGVGRLSFQGADALPGSVWEVKATVGRCLTGQANVTMGPEGDAIDIALTPVRNAALQVEVVDSEGGPIPGAVVVVRSEEGACVPNKVIPLGGNAGSVSVGPGTHKALVTAEGFRLLQEDFTVEANGSQTVRAVLQPEKVVLENDRLRMLDKVQFETRGDPILPESFELLDEVVEVIGANEISGVEIGVHTDSQGSASSNLALSQRRAEAVRAYLVEKGIPEEAVRAVGYGETQPLGPNRNAADRAKNRRVEFKIVDL